MLGDTYEATSSALTKLKDSGVSALKDTYVIDLDGSVVAQLYSNEPKKNLEKETILYFSKPYRTNIKRDYTWRQRYTSICISDIY